MILPLEWTIKTCLIAVIAFGVSLSLRRSSAAIRHLVWAAAFCAMASDGTRQSPAITLTDAAVRMRAAYRKSPPLPASHSSSGTAPGTWTDYSDRLTSERVYLMCVTLMCQAVSRTA